MMLTQSSISIPWFRQWFSTFDTTRGRLIVHLPAAGRRLHKLKPIILGMVNICEENRIAIEFHVTSGDGRRLVEEEENGIYPVNSAYTIESFFNIQRSVNLTHNMRPLYKYAHRVIIRRQDVLTIDDIGELSEVDIIVFSYPPERDLQSGGRWDQDPLDAMNQELRKEGLVIRTCNDRDLSSHFELISQPNIHVDLPFEEIEFENQKNWYDVWKKV